jgi:methyltransferase (TIGR00027 family)
MNLPDVARTAMLTLICRTLESEKEEPIIKDPMAVLCFERLMAEASEEEKAWILKRKQMYGGRGSAVIVENMQRQGYFDHTANQFIADHPLCTVINLGCGFDTRFWRIQNTNCTYVEVDLPELVELKKELLKGHLTYELIGCSVLDTSWIDKVTSKGNSNFLLMAEGLFMYLPSQEAARLLQVIGERFSHSQLVLDTLPEKYTKGFLRVRYAWGLDVSFLFGIKNPRDMETYGKDFKVIDVAKGPLRPIVTVSINAT